MNILEYALRNDVMQVCLHILEQDVHILVIICPYCLVYFDNVGMLELFQYLDLAIGPLGICGMLKCIEYFFECEDAFG